LNYRHKKGSIIFGVGDKKPAPFLNKKIETNDKTLIKYNRLKPYFKE